MILSIITINRNNAAGLEKTMASVLAQTYTDFEYVVVDGASTDGSVDVIRRFAEKFEERIKWISEPDTGIYNAMNKGIRMASGDYCQFLNSGDCLASNDVTERMLAELNRQNNPLILYGNMIKCFSDGRKMLNRGGKPFTMLEMYRGTLNHSPSYIRRDLFDKYGMYDESLKIVSDWKWFLQAIVFGGEIPVYADINVTLFDMCGISETNKDLEKAERKAVLAKVLPSAILTDYERYSFPIEQMDRLQRYPWAYRLVWFVERCLFKYEKVRNKKQNLIQ